MVAAAIVLTCSCGGAERRSDKRTSAAPPKTSATTDMFADHFRRLASRFDACIADVAAGDVVRISEECKAALRTLIAACSAADLRELEVNARVTEPCKEALWRLLPEGDSHRSRLLVLGSARAPGGLDIYLAASDAGGEPEPAVLDGVTVQLEVNGRLELVERFAIAPLPARCDAPIFAMSSILDYSGSMSDRDVDESIEIFRTLYAAVAERCLETEVIIFSTDVRRVRGFTADRAAMDAAVARNSQFPRDTTALVDALGDGARDVRQRRAPVRLLVVATDGMENASTRWSYDDAVQAARSAHARIISFGSLLSDIGVLDQLGHETGGFFIYRPRPSVLAIAARSVGRLLGSARRVHVADARLAVATHIVIEHGSQRVRLPLRE